MAIELHHLNTHGMMEQAGNVLDGVARLKARIAELEKENQTLAEDVSDKIESITELMELVEKYKSEKAELEEERRWRKFPDEKPRWGEEVIVVDDASKQYIVRFSYDMKWISWGNMNTCESKYVKYWMPLPSAPKEE